MRWSLSRLCQDHRGCVVKNAGNSTEWIMGSLGLYKASTAPAHTGNFQSWFPTSGRRFLPDALCPYPYYCT